MCVDDVTMCHATDPRALIFRQQQFSVTNLESLQKLMGYNHFSTDFLSLNDSCNVSWLASPFDWYWMSSILLQAISCRADLEPNPLDRYPFGAIDSKVSTVINSRKSSTTNRASDGSYLPMIMARLGPTTDDQPVFCWSAIDSKRNTRGKRFVHNGQPDCFAYLWQQFPPPI